MSKRSKPKDGPPPQIDVSDYLEETFGKPADADPPGESDAADEVDEVERARRDGKPISLAALQAKRCGDATGRLTCPKCGCQHFRVYRTVHKGDATTRVKFCRHCGHRILTREKPV